MEIVQKFATNTSNLKQEINVCQFVGTEQIGVLEKRERERERERRREREEFHLTMQSISIKAAICTIIGVCSKSDMF